MGVDFDGHRRRLLFVTHSAAASGAELLLVNLLRQRALVDGSVLFLAPGPLADRARAQDLDAAVLDVLGDAATVRREHGLWRAARLGVGLLPGLVPLARALRDADVVVAWSQKAFVLAATTAPLVRRPLVWALHDILSDEHFSPALRRTGVVLARLAAERVIATSGEARAGFARAGGDPARCTIVEPGIELDRFTTPAALTAPLPARGERLVVVHVGRLSPWKGQAVLLEALARVPEMEAWIVGAPLFGEADYAAALRRRAEARDLAGRVHWLGHRDDVPAVLQRADLFVHVPTAPEPFGQTVVEAMAAGLAVIVSDVGAPPRIVGAEAGMVVASGDAAALAESLRALGGDDARRATLAQAARRRAQGYGIASAAARWRDALVDLVEGGRP
jgi:glycosyltransferase involved in cell wall biosynthesis